MSVKESTVRCGVIGVGRMGRAHARIYAQSESVEFIGVIDTDADARQDVIDQWGGQAFPSIEAMLDSGVDAVSIATPTIHHRGAAETLLAANVACLVEKPLAPDAEQARILVEAAARSGTVLQVGHIVRYDPVMIALTKAVDRSPRFIEMDRISPMTFRSVDVGVVLDMMIHDLDLLLMLVGSEPQEIHANAVCVLGEAEDVCNARLVFPADSEGVSCVANVTASRLAMKTERKIRVISENYYVSADFVKRAGTIVRKTANEQQLAEVRRELQSGKDLSDVDYLDLVKVEDLDIESGEPLRLQIDDFLRAVRTGQRPRVDAQAGLAAVRTAERIVEAARRAGSRMV